MPHITLTSEQMSDAMTEYLSQGLPSALLGRISRVFLAAGADMAEKDPEFAERYALLAQHIQSLARVERAFEDSVGAAMLAGKARQS